MNLHEYQGKSILKSFGVAVQEGRVVDKVEDEKSRIIEVSNRSLFFILEMIF